ncbi:MerR family transcriptional regulator [Paenibacillus hexagrammi]|uniref:MerR family transcriptional regulator n=1 Tax=Paenibacillus hexagrammi TaxID=2908839 RepID=A0ABY3SJG7_9BACL|nr:MerR family transcriptional regulator [Paenibacillus sp. YPD9-1]UJF33628.1 MerR family transcriptional regulator [Paenibacillus sp. YPD9-1]
MLYTVKQLSALSHVTIKTLHHYHKIGLLIPREISDAGYRLYGAAELERLQQILFYRELEFPLEQVKVLLEVEPDRLTILSSQKKLLESRKQRLERFILTLEESIACEIKEETMEHSSMFKGFDTEEEWNDALAEQRQYVKETYDYDLLENVTIDTAEMNEQAAEAVRFMNSMKKHLLEGSKHDSEEVRLLIGEHLSFLSSHGHASSPADFAVQTRFFLGDDFHQRMLEDQQTGLSYYLCMAAEAYAAASQG